jgi:EAL and modified HD-GYP domain-containing signal transduction protein
MDVFVARQAIFDRNLKIHGYELLFRSRQEGSFDCSDGDMATLQVIANVFLSIGADKMLGGGQAFVNCPQSLLADERIKLLPPQTTVIEILESVQPEPEVIDACRNLKALGYRLALDDFTGQAGYGPLIDLADIIKVEFPALCVADRKALCKEYGKRGIRMLAEKVETREEFKQALEMGYSLYQGFFFARPATVRSRQISGYKQHYLNLLREIHKPEIDHKGIARLIQREVSLAHRLLRYVNSVAFGRIGSVGSIAEAVALLGDDGIRNWIWLAALPKLASDKPGELVMSAMIRARFCESIAPLAGLSNRASDLFLVGLLSFLDAMLDRPLEELLGELHLPRDEERALLGGWSAKDRLAVVYALVRNYGDAEWDTLVKCANQLQIKPEVLPALYAKSVAWAEEMFRRGRNES